MFYITNTDLRKQVLFKVIQAKPKFGGILPHSPLAFKLPPFLDLNTPHL